MQFSLRAFLAGALGIAFVVALFAVAWRIRSAPPPPDWLYENELHEAISSADRIDVRHGIVRENQPLSETKLLFGVSNAKEIAEVNKQLRFQRNQYGGGCSCVGLLRIQWYNGETLLATTSLMHGESIRWYEARGDIAMTRRSAKWMTNWLVSHGCDASFVVDPPFPPRPLN